VKPLERRIFDARRAGEINSEDIPSQIDEAEQKGILTPAEAEAVRAFDRRMLEVTGVDDFAAHALRRDNAERSERGSS
jgi:acyl-CoA dehydrogenase